MKFKSRVLMIIILGAMLTLTLLGALTLDKKESKVPEEVIENDSQEENTVVPVTFKGQIEDEYGVAKEVMDVIVSYMDAYYTSIFTLEKRDMSDLFDNELMAAVSDKAVSLLIETRKDYDFDFTMKAAHYDLKVVAYEENGDEYRVDILEDDYMSFSFLPGIESKTYEVENYFRIKKSDGVYRINDLEKVQGYYMTFYDNAESVEDTDEIYVYYRKQLKDMHAYNDEVLKVKAQKTPYTASKSFVKAYDRDKAVAYADTYYHERNKDWYNFTDEGGNCQNYASQCLLQGGIEMDFYGEEQWKCYINDPDYDPYINEDETPEGRTRSWVNVGYFYNYAKYNEGKGLVAEANANLYYAQPSDIIMVGNGGLAHTVIVSKVVDGHILVDSNSIDMKDYPIEAYTYTDIMLIKILGNN
ncbi:MAG: amidase domain-containing protein [Erysipelotrichaceae bacterium]|nr:amidase domain-containing protein [Erysipelotrichaceae bacterium]